MTHFAGRAGKVLFLSVLTAMLLAATALAADIATGAGCTTGSSLRLRAEPSTSASVVTTLDKSVAVAILDDSVDGWYKIAYNGSTGYVSADYLNVDQDNVFTTYGRVNSDGVNVRSDASTDSSVLATIEEDAIVTVNGLVDGWYDVTCEYGTEGYIRSDFLDLTESSSSNSDIAATAKQYLGTGYVYGGASPRGFDCSGFTMYVYSQHGYSLPHSATSQWQSGLGPRVYSISELQPGDLVFFNDPSRNAGKACSHAGIYTGDGQFIHSSSSRSGGVIVSSLTSGYYNTYFVGGIQV
ncbi:SH3 domain-containing protein [Oscillibacter sp.]|uniref:C40 family peptidase n=1 Tax=Oscillibacter sp. TaxID=1945593 RepID=UPI00258D8B8D|nr:SH3 domain-containing protein [Oscillibacter sp.]